MLLGDSTARFQAGLAAFLVGHLAYVVCFAAARPGPVVVVLPRGGRGGAALVATRQVLPTVHRSDGPALSAPGRRLHGGDLGDDPHGLAHRRVAGGRWARRSSSSSDATLAVNRFVRPLSWARVAIMVTYHVGQALIVLGVLAAT